jgi:phenylalanyl-tRNA synthetase beta chain
VKVSYNWLREFVDIPWEPRELADRLEASGTAVESITDYAPRFTGVVIGIIKSIEAHPQADKLQVTTIDTGSGEELRIVCGASNIDVGQKVPVAMIGAVLPGGHKIAKASLRGVESHGMLCSETELELGEDARGIMILDSATAVGKSLDKILNLNDTVIEFEITPNRPDCMSMIGIAREVAALTGGKLTLPPVDIREAGDPGDTAIKLASPDLCPRYTARTVRGLSVGLSPFWLRRRLALAGIRPINNLVDVTNYVLLETGQPLHGFDKPSLEKTRS